MKAIKYAVGFVLMATSRLMGQGVMTSSPYSMFGVGEIASGLYGQNVAMGGVAYGMRGASLINRDNPAGLTGLDSCSLMAETSLFLRSERAQSGGSSNHAVSGNMSAFSLAGRIIPRWYVAVGIMPYSFVGYYFKSSQPLEGSLDTDYDSEFEGSGGLSKACLTHAFRLTRHLSMGVNLNYVFGNMEQSETQSSMSVTQTLYGRAFLADFGLQYYRQVGREAALTLGAVYGYRRKISLENSITIINGDAGTEVKKKTVRQSLPQFAGAGGALQYKKMTYALDYTFRRYGSLSSGDSRVKFNDAHELRAGACYRPNGYPSATLWQRMSYKMGACLSTPYMQVRGKSGISYRVSAGLGMPVLNGYVNAAVFHDRMQLRGNALNRSVTGVTVTYTLGELFHRVKL
ncbi:hypothetical protein DW095_13440 [Bacteroides sp. AM07-16]|uniref:hypothetical protein n=2 Tax=Parabacteroides bouchesdurhonensis TaxID=1936995 RepID=UPI000E50BE73|nr:hypothetical protein [Parabacteroides bouchesdurhonensis]RHJ90300.1 hypothetical protein DW095_13440 [Bacteroides sp. AM07-16]